MEEFFNALKALDMMLEHLDKKGYARTVDGIELTCYPDGSCEIYYGFHSKAFDSIEEFMEFMDKKTWKKRFK
jgi:hypothetical protein